MLLLENLKKTIQKIAEVLKLKADKSEIVQSDWAQTDVNNKAFIRNKPVVLGGEPDFVNNVLVGGVELDSMIWEKTPNVEVTKYAYTSSLFYIDPNQIVSFKYKDTATFSYRFPIYPTKCRVYIRARTPEGVLLESMGEQIRSNGLSDLIFNKVVTIRNDFSFSFHNTSNTKKWVQIHDISVSPLENKSYTTINDKSFIRNTEKYVSPQVSLCGNVIYTEPETTYINIRDYSITYYPEYFTQYHTVVVPGCKVVFHSNVNLTAPDGFEISGVGSYGILIKNREKFILRINKVQP